MPEVDLKRLLDDASHRLQDMHHAVVGELQKANEAEALDYVHFLEAQIESISDVTRCIDAVKNGKDLPFI